MTGSSYIDVFQVQGVQILMVSLPQYRRSPFTCDGASQHSTLAHRYCCHADFLVLWKGEQVRICWWDKQKLEWLSLAQFIIFETINLLSKSAHSKLWTWRLTVKNWIQLSHPIFFSTLSIRWLFILLMAHNLPTEMFQNSWFSHICLVTKHKNKNTQYKRVSISCYRAIAGDTSFFKYAPRQHNYCILHSNERELSLTFCKYFA